MLFILRAFILLLLALLMAVMTLWGALALWFQLPVSDLLRAGGAGVFALLGIGCILTLATRARIRGLAVFAVTLLCVALWWRGITPPTDGDWSPDVARQVTGVIKNNQLALTDVRNFTWRTPKDFTPGWDTRTYDLATLTGVDLFMSYWDDSGIAHMIVSFGFENDTYIAWSVEVRRKIDSTYSPVADMFKAHTLSLVAADERDVVGTRTNARGEDVRLYRLNTDPETARALLERYVRKANALAQEPQWYNSIFTNCTTVVFDMVRQMISTVPLDWRVFLNGYLPDYAYDQGVLDSRLSFEELRDAADIVPAAKAHGLEPGFSHAIRQSVPDPRN